MNTKLYVVAAVDCGDSCSGHATVLGAFHKAKDAVNYVRQDMEDRCEQMGGRDACQLDFQKYELTAGSDNPICLWTIDEVEVK